MPELVDPLTLYIEEHADFSVQIENSTFQKVFAYASATGIPVHARDIILPRALQIDPGALTTVARWARFLDPGRRATEILWGSCHGKSLLELLGICRVCRSLFMNGPFDSCLMSVREGIMRRLTEGRVGLEEERVLLDKAVFRRGGGSWGRGISQRDPVLIVWVALMPLWDQKVPKELREDRDSVHGRSTPW